MEDLSLFLKRDIHLTVVRITVERISMLPRWEQLKREEQRGQELSPEGPLAREEQRRIQSRQC